MIHPGITPTPSKPLSGVDFDLQLWQKDYFFIASTPPIISDSSVVIWL